MNIFPKEKWLALLPRLNSNLPPTVRSLPPATETEIAEAEDRLGLNLPPSYRSFLSVSNGWPRFNSFIERLVPIEEVQRFQTADPESLAGIQRWYQEDLATDEEYLDYETPKHNVLLRHRYFPECLLIGEPTNGGELVLLNPHIISPDGEWETIFFANWLPGNQRHRSFYEFAKASIEIEE